MTRIKLLTSSVFLSLSFFFSYLLSQPKVLLVLPAIKYAESPIIALSAPEPTSTPLNSSEIPKLTPFQVKQLVQSEAKKQNVNPVVAQFIISHESGYDCDRIGDGGLSHGCAQIYQPAHPEISIASATDPNFAIPWAVHHMSYEPEIFSTFRWCRQMYPDCPFP